MKNISVWAKDCEKSLVDKGMNKKELAQILRLNYTVLCNVINGHVINDSAAKQICAYLGVEY